MSRTGSYPSHLNVQPAIVKFRRSYRVLVVCNYIVKANRSKDSVMFLSRNVRVVTASPEQTK